MVISLPITSAQKKTAEKAIEIKVPNVAEFINNNKFVNAFRTVLQAPVK
jgi:hypothetical protein